AEKDSLEKTLFALRSAFDGTATEVDSDGKPGGFGKIENRQSYYEELGRLPQEGSYRIEVLAGKSPAELAALAKRNDDTGLAVRYALTQLDPFAVVGGNYSPERFPDGTLDRFNASFETGLTDKWIDARAKFLDVFTRYNIADGDLPESRIDGYYEDKQR